MTAPWLAFWDTAHSIYVNARHKDVHYRLIAQAILRFVPGPAARVLDYGSGEALHADLVASAAGEVLLCDGAPRLRAATAARFAGNPKIRVVSPQEAAKLSAHTLDLVVLHSVAQYLTPGEAEDLFSLFHRLLRPDGRLVIGDIIPPAVSARTDAMALLRFAAANGFFLAAVAGLARTRLSNYWRLRRRFGLARYSEAAMIDKLAAFGFKARRDPINLGHNQARMTFVADPR